MNILNPIHERRKNLSQLNFYDEGINFIKYDYLII